MGGIGEVIDNKVPLELAKMLVDKVSKEEIEKTLFSLPNIKALGPDSFGVLFFMKAWNVVEEEVVEAIKDFFLSEELLKEINCTFIVLVLKCPNPHYAMTFGLFHVAILFINASPKLWLIESRKFCLSLLTKIKQPLSKGGDLEIISYYAKIFFTTHISPWEKWKIAP